MSNEYIVLNTKKHDTTFWDTIKSTYTPSAGEVCIIVPSSITNDNKIEVVEYQNKNLFDEKTAVAIKIGDGKTVFRDLPELSDISNIHPDWDETDTTSPNYIWHKPITNSDLISIGEKTALIIEDREAINALKFEEDFNGELYCKLKSLEGGPNHPYDLLTEEDNTWGYYDINYGNAINHETKYFYKNNILLKRDLVTKTDEVKSILIQKINERINWENNYQ